MRLALAATFLAQRTLESVAAEPKAAARAEHDDLLLDGTSSSGEHVLLSNRRKQRGASGRPVLVFKKLDDRVNKWTGGVLRNDRVADNKKKPVECVPKISEEDEPDVGILSCGTNHYCVESEESLLGGVCTEYGTNVHRFLEDFNVTDGSICDPTSEDYLGGEDYDCNCTNFDLVTRTGSYECVIYENYCFYGAYPICASVTSEVTASS